MKVLLIGEICTDEHVYCNVDRVSPEAPVPIADVVWISQNSGMSGNIAANLEALGVEVYHCLTESRQYTWQYRTF